MEKLNNIRKKTRFTQISNICLHDRNLSLDSRALMCILLSYPNNWQFFNKHISKVSNIGIDKLNKLYKQLEKYGYLKRIQKRDDKGKFRGFEFEICDEGSFEIKVSLESTMIKTPLRQKTGTDISVTVKSVAINTNHIDNNYQERMNELNQKLLQKQLNKDIKIQKLENLAVSTQNQINF